MSHKLWTLGPNASGGWMVEFDSDPGVVVVVPQPEHLGVHEHSFGYSNKYVEVEGGKWRYGITVTNRTAETSHFRIRWATNL